MADKNAGETGLRASVPPRDASPSDPVEIVGHHRRADGGEGPAGDAAIPDEQIAPTRDPMQRAKPAETAAQSPTAAKPADITAAPRAEAGVGPIKPAERPLPGPAPPARRLNPNGAPPWFLSAQPPTASRGQLPPAPARPGPGAAPPAGARPGSSPAIPPLRPQDGPRPSAQDGIPPGSRPAALNGAPPAAQPQRNGGQPSTAPAAPATPAAAAGRPAPAPGTWRPLPGPALATPQRRAPERIGRLSSFAPDPEPATVRPAPVAPGTAQDFAPAHIRRPKVAPATRGWRVAVRRLTFGQMSPGPGLDERRERELIAAAKTPIATCRRVAIVSRKGGIGKTTTTLMLGHTFATHRGDRVVALDANPDAGSLAYRVNRETGATVTQLLRAVDRIQRYSDMRTFTSQSPTRLEVLASDDDPTISVALGEAEYREVLHVLEHHYNLILMDTGTGILDSATQGILRMADQIVLCAAPGIDASRASSLTLDWLDEHGYHDLVSDAVVVINQVRKDRGKELRSVVQHFAKRCRAVVKVPWDAHLAQGMEVDIDLLRPATRRSYLKAVAAVARSFALPSPRR